MDHILMTPVKRVPLRNDSNYFFCHCTVSLLSLMVIFYHIREKEI